MSLIIALDVSDRERAFELVDLLKPHAAMFKVGMELFYSAGPDSVKEIKKRGGRVFLDLKLHDIPNTVSRALKVLTGLGPDMINIHAAGGPEMMRAAADAVRKESAALGQPRPLLVAVTVLTSINQDIFNNHIGVKGNIGEYVSRWSKMAMDNGLDGVVASPAEVKLIREACGPDFVIVTPGVRPPGSAAGDQKRIMTPAGAISAGATYIVVGRPVTASENPLTSTLKIIDDVKRCVR